MPRETNNPLLVLIVSSTADAICAGVYPPTILRGLPRPRFTPELLDSGSVSDMVGCVSDMVGCVVSVSAWLGAGAGGGTGATSVATGECC